MAVFAVVFLVCVYELGSYISSYIRSARISAELRAAYHADDTPIPESEPSPTAVPIPTDTPVPTAEPILSPTPYVQPTLDPFATPVPRAYPNNPYKTITSRFTKIRRQNSDIIGWLQVGSLVDEAVVQRDNSYYLRRDYRGYHNNNGAIFLDEACDITTRPYTLILYGHNMKTGAMFGGLRNFENITYYRNSPFITFDSMYEDGRYVIFSVADVSLNVQNRDYAGFFRLNNCTNMERDAIIQDLCRLSKHTCVIDVNSEDQLLLLVTCVDDDSNRRVIAARRIRDGESENDLYKLIQTARKK